MFLSDPAAPTPSPVAAQPIGVNSLAAAQALFANSGVRVEVRTVAADALAFGARAVVMAHNHPSGDARPSGDDRLLVRRLARALDALEVRLLDHLVLTRDGYSSLRGLGML
jgi:DNA repair protein RadC